MKEKNTNYGVLVAGGTGGHINAALALGEVLEKKINIKYVTGKRPLDFKLYEKKNSVYHINASPLLGRGPLSKFTSLVKNLIVFCQIFYKFLINRPKFILGAGGYVCGPTLLAGSILCIPTYILEQNSVMGLTNSLLSIFVNKIFVHFKETINLKKYLVKKVILSGNPVRSEILKVENIFSPEKQLNVLIFGGSLGAKDINELAKEMANLNLNFKLNIRHQTGQNAIMEEAKDNLNQGGPNDYIALRYLDDMASEYQWADCVVCRGGATSIAELRVVNRPALILPYSFHRDKHQFHNAMFLKRESHFPIEVLYFEELKIDLKQKLFKILEEFYQYKTHFNEKVVNKKLEKNKRIDSIGIIVSELLSHV